MQELKPREKSKNNFGDFEIGNGFLKVWKAKEKNVRPSKLKSFVPQRVILIKWKDDPQNGSKVL
jgi:hypothetical protein